MPPGHSVLAPACARCYIALRRGPLAGAAAAASALPSLKLGNAGRIERRGVTRFSQRPSDPYSPPGPTLVVQSGAMLTLFEHHFGCTVMLDTVDGRTVLRISSSFSYPGHPGRKDEYEVPLSGWREGRRLCSLPLGRLPAASGRIRPGTGVHPARQCRHRKEKDQ